jgi:sigma-B regulation protein RsbU (phosphoserine phosphatase)
MEWSPEIAAQSLGPEIAERRRVLLSASSQTPPAGLDSLVAEFDAALQRIQNGSYGRCETCHDPIEQERLQADPLVRFCLDHMDPGELRAHERDLELAGQIQAKMLPPRHLRAAGYEACYIYQSAGPVGGDHCELIPSDDGQSLFFAIGDVAGKGVAASLLMTHLSAILRSLLSVGLPVPDVMARANRLLCENTLSSHYATLICGRICSGGAGELSHAGHCRPLLLRRDSAGPIQAAGIPLGLFCRSAYPSIPFHLDPGESLLLYTDGLTEARDPSGAEFGEQRLLSLIGSLRSSCCLAGAAELVDSIAGEVERFRQDSPLHDDLTVVAIRRTG